MTYDNSQFMASPMSYGRKGAQLDLSVDRILGASVKAIEVVQAGDLVYRPVDGTSDITVIGAPVGYQPPHVPGIVRSVGSGTTAAVVTVED